MTQRNSRFLSVCAAMLVVGGCSLVTEFPTYDDGGPMTVDLYDLAVNVDDPVVVTLSDDGFASISLELDEAIPDPQGVTDEELAELIGQTILLDVTDTDEGGVTVSLTSGKRLTTGEPTEEGEYTVSLSKNRQVISVRFLNDFEGRSLREEGSYISLVQVQPNSYFITGSFERLIDVVNAGD